MDYSYFGNSLISGINLGLIYAVIALGFVLIFKCSGVLNMAQGSLCMLGAFMCYTLCGMLGLNFYLAIFLTLILSLPLGWLIERLILRPLIGQPTFTVLMVTIALLVFFEGFCLAVWGAKYYGYPEMFGGVTHVGGLDFSHMGLFSTGVCIVLFGAFVVFYRRFRIGITMRALADDEQAAQSVGIKVSTTYRMSWMISCVCASVGGILLAYLVCIHPWLGLVGLRAIPAVIVGGLESVPGALVGGLIIGVLEAISGAYLDPILSGVKEVAPFVVLVLILIFKPFGLFGLERIERI